MHSSERFPRRRAVKAVGSGLGYSDLDQDERAIQDYDEAIRLNPEFATAYYNRGRAYKIIGKQIEAERDFATAKELGFPAP